MALAKSQYVTKYLDTSSGDNERIHNLEILSISVFVIEVFDDPFENLLALWGHLVGREDAINRTLPKVVESEDANLKQTDVVAMQSSTPPAPACDRQASPPKGNSEDKTHRCRFVLTSTVCEVEYNGTKVHFTVGGFRIIHRLLCKPGTLLLPSELLVRTGVPDDPCSRQGAMDRKYLHDVLAKKLEWQGVIDDPKSTEVDRNEAHEELKKLNDTLNNSTYKGRPKNENNKKARSAYENVRNQLSLAYEKLRSQGLDELADHFERRIEPNGTGYVYTLSGLDHISWQLND